MESSSLSLLFFLCDQDGAVHVQKNLLGVASIGL